MASDVLESGVLHEGAVTRLQREWEEAISNNPTMTFKHWSSYVCKARGEPSPLLQQ